jgi:predicted permease
VWRRLRKFLGAAVHRDRFEDGMADEMRFHLDTYAADLERAGLPRDAAKRRARLEFGSPESLKEDCRQSRGLRLLDEVRQDLRYAARQMAKSPGFTTAAVLSVALGIGANTAIFSLMDAVLFRTVDVRNPDELVFIAHAAGTDVSTSSNLPLVERYQRARVLAGVTAYQGATLTVRADAGAELEEEEGQWVSGNYFSVVAPRFAAGRGFAVESDRNLSAPLEAVISDAYWARRFDRSPDTIGRTLTINGRPVTIVGVTAAEFKGLRSGSATEITLPIAARAMDYPDILDDRGGWVSIAIVGRMRPGQTREQARAEVDAVFRPFWLDPENAWARESAERAAERAELLPASRGSAGLREQYARPLLLLMGLVAVVLLIACANVANLLLARAAARAREVAVRMGIGAGRARLVRQFLVESLALSGVGGALGLIVAVVSTRGILALLDTGPAPLVIDAGLNAGVLGFAMLASLATGVSFGIVPALRVSRGDLTTALKSSRTSTMAGGRYRTHQSLLGRPLLVGQFALCMVVVAIAGLLALSLYKLKTLDTGFSRDQVVMFEVKTGKRAFTPERRAMFYEALLERLARIAGVTSATLADRSPMDFSSQERRIEVPGFAKVRGGVSSVTASPAYFRTLGITLVRGREFTDADRLGSPTVAVVSESMAAKYFGGADALGHDIVIGGRRDTMSIVGIVRDTRHESLWSNPPRTVYIPLAQPGEAFDGASGPPVQLTAIIRTSGDSREITTAAARVIRELSADAVVSYPRTMAQQLDASLVTERLLGTLSVGFALLATVLAVIGLYGVMSYGVVRRTRETAIRLALGATRRSVLLRFLGESVVVSVAGVTIGLTATLGATRAVAALLFDLKPHDPLILGTMAAVLIATGVAAGIFPARSAAAIEPATALRSE